MVHRPPITTCTDPHSIWWRHTWWHLWHISCYAMLMSIRRFGRLRIIRQRKFVSATTQFYFYLRTHFHRTHFHRPCPLCPRAVMPGPPKPKAGPPVTSLRPAQGEEEDDDLSPLELRIGSTPSFTTNWNTRFRNGRRGKTTRRRYFRSWRRRAVRSLWGFDCVRKKPPKPRSAHTDKVAQYEIGTEINTHWFKYLTEYPRSDRARSIRRQKEERTEEKITRAQVPILAQTFEKNHVTGALNTKALAIAIRIALERKMNDAEYGMLIDNKTFVHWSKMLAAYLRHEKITHSADGSISIELAMYEPFIRQLRHSYDDHTDMQGLFGKYTADHILIPNSFRRYGQLIPFYMPLALVLVYNDKNRFEMAIVRSAEHMVATLPPLHEKESFPSFKDDSNQIISWPEYTEIRQQYASRVLYMSGQSANPEVRTGVKLTREYIKAHPTTAFWSTQQFGMPCHLSRSTTWNRWDVEVKTQDPHILFHSIFLQLTRSSSDFRPTWSLFIAGIRFAIAMT